jgi:hypothetical protein
MDVQKGIYIIRSRFLELLLKTHAATIVNKNGMSDQIAVDGKANKRK